MQSSPKRCSLTFINDDVMNDENIQMANWSNLFEAFDKALKVNNQNCSIKLIINKVHIAGVK